MAVCITTEEQDLIGLVNQYRIQHGLNALMPSMILMQSAKEYAAYMASHDYFSHTGPDGSSHTDRAHRLGYPKEHWVGANILWGQPDARSAFEAWRNSPDHNDNLLNPHYREIGVALAVEETWDYSGDVYRAASMELSAGSTEAALPCGQAPAPPIEEKPQPEKPLPPPERPDRPSREERKALRKAERIRQRVWRQIRRSFDWLD